MRDRSIDEFESLFERASIPVLDIRNVALARISAVLKGDTLDESVLTLAAHLKRRFGGGVTLMRSRGVSAERVAVAAEAQGFTVAERPFASTAELVGQVCISRSQFLVLSESTADADDELDLDALVQGTTPPVLVIRRPVSEPTAIFGNILHSLTGHFQQTQNFAYSFTLAEDGGRLMLLHTIAAHEVQEVRDTLQVTPDITDESADALVERLAHHGERYLKAVVAASRQRPFDVSYRLAVGEIVPAVRSQLDVGDYGLLVVGCHHEGHSQVTAEDYQLMHQVRDLPVLAL